MICSQFLFKDWFYCLFQENTISQIIKTNKELKNILQNIVLPKRFDILSESNKHILKKWIAYQIFKNKNFSINKILEIDALLDSNYNTNIFNKLNDLSYDFSKLEEDNDKYHEYLSEFKSREYEGQIDDLGLPEINGYKWGTLNKEYCEDYGKSMGHCGNINYKEGDNIFTLYEVKNTKINHLTFIINNKVLGESKGRKNQKPSSKYFPNIKQLLLSDYVESIKGMGYSPKNNFQFTDLSKTDQEDILSKKPNIDNLVGYLTNNKEKYIKIDDNFIFNKSLSNREFFFLITDLYNSFKYEPIDFVYLGQNKEGYFCVNAAIESDRRGIEIPDFIIDCIASNPEYSYYYAEDFYNFKNVPENFLQAISNDVYLAYRFWKNAYKNPNEVNTIIYNSIVNFNINKLNNKDIMAYSNINYYLANEVYNYENVPDRVVENISLNSDNVSKYAKDLVWLDKNVPDLILNKLLNSPFYFGKYIDILYTKYQTIPDYIINKIDFDSIKNIVHIISSNKLNVPQRLLLRINELGYSQKEKSFLMFELFNNYLRLHQIIPRIVMDSILAYEETKDLFYKMFPKEKDRDIFLKNVVK